MLHRKIPGATRTLGRSQGFRGLAVLDCETEAGPAMTSAWEPTPDELRRLLAGASIYVTVLGTAHPPIALHVGDPPEA